jgi:hypothetical protein
MRQPVGVEGDGVPFGVRWFSGTFGVTAIAFIVQGINRAYVATQMGTVDGTYSVEYVAKTTHSILGALVCMTVAVLPVVWWNLTHPRRQRIEAEPATTGDRR